jgi:hypothetical protein
LSSGKMALSVPLETNLLIGYNKSQQIDLLFL